MKIKNFIIYTIIYIGIVWIITFMLSDGSYTFKFFSLNVTLPNSIWFIIPIIIFAILCILGAIYNKFIDFRSKRLIKIDASLYNTLAKEILLGLESNKDFKTDFFKAPREITKFLSPWKMQEYDPNILPEDLAKVVENVKKIQNGEFADLSKYKIQKQNPLVIQNELNRLKIQPNTAEEILKKRGIESEIGKQAYLTMLLYSSFSDIKKYKMPKSKEEIYKVLDRYANENSFEIPKDDIYSILKNGELNKDDYMYFTKKLSNKMEPESLIAIFTNLKNENLDAYSGCCYLLYEFGMIDKLKEELNSNEDIDNDKFKILLFLKENNKNISASYMF